MLGFLDVRRIDNDQFFPAGVIRQGDAHDVIAAAGVTATSATASANDSTSSCIRFNSSNGKPFE